jgi:hypothetical protein
LNPMSVCQKRLWPLIAWPRKNTCMHAGPCVTRPTVAAASHTHHARIRSALSPRSPTSVRVVAAARMLLCKHSCEPRWAPHMATDMQSSSSTCARPGSVHAHNNHNPVLCKRPCLRPSGSLRVQNTVRALLFAHTAHTHAVAESSPSANHRTTPHRSVLPLTGMFGTNRSVWLTGTNRSVMLRGL